MEQEWQAPRRGCALDASLSGGGGRIAVVVPNVLPRKVPPMPAAARPLVYTFDGEVMRPPEGQPELRRTRNESVLAAAVERDTRSFCYSVSHRCSVAGCDVTTDVGRAAAAAFVRSRAFAKVHA